MALSSLSIAIVVASLYGSTVATQDRQKPPEKRSSQSTELRAAPIGASEDFRVLEEQARSGNSEVMYAVGESYRTAGDSATALMWYFRAASKGNADAARRVRELTQPFAADPAQTRTAHAALAPTAHNDVQSPDGRSPLLMVSITVAGISLLFSVVAVYFSLSRTRQALRDAGLL